MKFKNPSMHSSKDTACIKKRDGQPESNMPPQLLQKLQRAITHKVNQVIYTSSPVSIPRYIANTVKKKKTFKRP